MKRYDLKLDEFSRYSIGTIADGEFVRHDDHVAEIEKREHDLKDCFLQDKLQMLERIKELESKQTTFPGTLRDWFAGMAMQGYIAHDGYPNRETMADIWDIANKMIVESEKRK